jgi:hypothetical protein
MPYMGKETEEKSIKKFKSVLVDTFKPKSKTIVELGLAARRIGGVCKNIRNHPISDGAAHISVSSSGEFSHTVKDGAQAKAVQEAMSRILNVVADETKMEDTPFGLVRQSLEKSSISLLGQSSLSLLSWVSPRNRKAVFGDWTQSLENS